MEGFWVALLFGVLGLGLLWCVLSVALSIRWLFLPQPLEYLRQRGNWIVAILLGALACLGIILYIGTERLMYFVPAEWGSWTKDGEFRAHREILSSLLAMGIGSVIAYGYYTLASLKAENFRLRVAAQTAERKEALRRFHSVPCLVREEKRMRALRDELRERDSRGQNSDTRRPPRIVLSTADAIELEILDGLLAEFPGIREEVIDRVITRRLRDIRPLPLHSLVEKQREFQRTFDQLEARQCTEAALSPEDESERQILRGFLAGIAAEVEHRTAVEPQP
ncbi:MAG: hypothetical protein QM570_19610 [Planctomycetota bacterium]|jgi:hypothetical protein|nr:hypothetical protein [Planctomycetota bacterium]